MMITCSGKIWRFFSVLKCYLPDMDCWDQADAAKHRFCGAFWVNFQLSAFWLALRFNFFQLHNFRLGRALPKSGDIRVFGHRPGTKASQVPGPGVGYMPQDTALYNEFSIQETINYFAAIFSLSHEVKKSRLQNLLKFLDLPDKNRLVKNLRLVGKIKMRLMISIIVPAINPRMAIKTWTHFC